MAAQRRLWAKVSLVIVLSLLLADALGYAVARRAFEESEVDALEERASRVLDAISTQLSLQLEQWSAALAHAATHPGDERAVLDDLLEAGLSGAAVLSPEGAPRAALAKPADPDDVEDTLDEAAARYALALHAGAPSMRAWHLDGDTLVASVVASDGSHVVAWSTFAAYGGILAYTSPILAAEAVPPADEATVTASARVAGASFVLVTSEPVAPALARAEAAASRLLVFTTVAYVVVGSVILGILAQTLSPLRRITIAAEKLGREQEAEPVEVSTGDEIEVLARTLNEASARIAQGRRAMQQAAEEFELAVGQTTREALLAGSTEQLCDAIAHSAAGLAGGAASVRRVGGTIASYAAREVREGETARLDLHGDDEPLWLEVRAPVITPATERKLQILAAQSAIAMERLRALEDAQRREAANRLLLDTLTDAVVVVDDAGALTFANAAARAHGFALGAPIGAAFEDASLAAAQALLAAATNAAGPVQRVRTRAARLMDATARRVTFAGAAATLLVLQDVTERVRLEDEAEERRAQLARSERLSALGTLVAGVAHEINNPLTYIAGNIELTLLDLDEARDALAKAGAQDGPDLDAARQRLASALSGTERIGEITRALKSVARQGTGGAREAVDVATLARNVEALVSVGLPDGVEVRFDVDEQAGVVRGSSSALHQVLLNLVKNAIEAVSTRGAGLVQVECRADGDDVRLTVKDDGPGIPRDVAQRLFTPFFTTKPGGTGLGLSIAHGIVKDHGGSIELRSEPGAGAEFRIRLPRSPESPRPPPPFPAA